MTGKIVICALSVVSVLPVMSVITEKCAISVIFVVSVKSDWQFYKTEVCFNSVNSVNSVTPKPHN